MAPEILSIPTFSLALLAAYVAATLVVARRFLELGRPAEWAAEACFSVLIGGVIGAHAWWLVQHSSELELGKLFDGAGLVWYGGLAGGALAAVAWTSWRGMLNLTTFDLGVTAAALGQAIGRIGCQLSGDGDYGTRSDLPWAMGYPDGTVPTPPGVTVHPTPVYESIALSLIALFLWRKRDAYRPGVLTAAYLVLAGGQRFLVEFVRRNEDVLVGLTAAQVVSACMVAGGAAWLVALHSRGRLARGSLGVG